MPAKDFAAEVDGLESELETNRFHAVSALRVVEEEWARDVLGLRPTRRPGGGWAFDPKLVAEVRRLVERGIELDRAREAARHLEAAERWQWEIGTWSTGAGEGLASMFEVRSLELARAWLLAALAQKEPTLMKAARDLVDAVARDPNRIGERHAKHVEALFRFLR
jgi:hypothetical protein